MLRALVAGTNAAVVAEVALLAVVALVGAHTVAQTDRQGSSQGRQSKEKKARTKHAGVVNGIKTINSTIRTTCAGLASSWDWSSGWLPELDVTNDAVRCRVAVTPKSSISAAPQHSFISVRIGRHTGWLTHSPG